MDYAGWELERQRNALAALLLGGGTEEADGEEGPGRELSREGENFPGGARRGAEGRSGGRRLPEENGRFRERGGFDRDGAEAPGVWEPARDAGRKGGRPVNGARDEAFGPVAAGSAWEEILGAEPAPEVLERLAWGAAADAAEAETDLVRRGTDFPGGGTGAGMESREVSQRTGVRGVAPEAAEMARPGARLEPDGSFGGSGGAEAGDDGRSANLMPGGGDAAGSNVNGGRMTRTDDVRWGKTGVVGSLERGGGAALSEAAGRETPWSGGWGTAGTRAEDDARSLSRAVQRDARRYDGGFTIY